MANGDEAAVDLEGARIARHRVAQVEVGQCSRRTGLETFDRLVPQHADLRMIEQAFLQDLLRAQFVAAMDQRHIVRMVGQVQGFFDCGIAAADHCYLLAAIEEAIARGTG